MPDDAPVRVLVVSADGGLRETLAFVALRHGAYVATSGDAIDAFSKCTSAHPPDIVVIDGRRGRGELGSADGLLDGLASTWGSRPRAILLGDPDMPAAWWNHAAVAKVLEPPFSVSALESALGEAVNRASIRPPAFSRTRMRGVR